MATKDRNEKIPCYYHPGSVNYTYTMTAEGQKLKAYYVLLIISVIVGIILDIAILFRAVLFLCYNHERILKRCREDCCYCCYSPHERTKKKSIKKEGTSTIFICENVTPQPEFTYDVDDGYVYDRDYSHNRRYPRDDPPRGERSPYTGIDENCVTAAFLSYDDIKNETDIKMQQEVEDIDSDEREHEIGRNVLPVQNQLQKDGASNTADDNGRRISDILDNTDASRDKEEEREEDEDDDPDDADDDTDEYDTIKDDATSTFVTCDDKVGNAYLSQGNLNEAPLLSNDRSPMKEEDGIS